MGTGSICYEIKELKKQTEEYTNKLTEMENRINELNEDNKNLKEQKDKIIYDFEKLNSNYEKVKKEKNKEIDKLISKLDEANEFNNQTKYLNRHLESQKTELQNMLKENEEYIMFLEKEKNNFINQLYSYNKEINNSIEKAVSNILNNETYKIKNQITILINNYDYSNRFNKEKEKEIEKAIKHFTNKSKHMNIILTGKTGVGKSELVNALTGMEVAKTGGYKPVTNKVTWYESGSLRLCDNPGYEISKENNLDRVIGRTKEEIENSKKRTIPMNLFIVFGFVQQGQDSRMKKF